MLSFCLSNVHTTVTIFSTGGKFRLVLNFTELYTLTQATRSYVLLLHHNTTNLGQLGKYTMNQIKVNMVSFSHDPRHRGGPSSTPGNEAWTHY